MTLILTVMKSILPALIVVSRELAADRLLYDPNSGSFLWRKTLSSAGTVDARTGYLRVCINYRLHKAHRLAWLLHYGCPMPPLIDHINGDKLDNRIVNLRAATRSENAWNQRAAHAGSRSNHLGVSYDDSARTKKPWRAKITAHNVTHWLGRFKTEEEAAEAYKRAKQTLHNIHLKG